MDQLGDALGDARIGEGTEQLGCAARRFVRRARNDGAARGQRGGHLLRQQIEREVPRSEGRDGADRLADHPRELPGRANQRAAIVALDLFGIPVEQLRAAHHLGLGLGQDLALFLRHDRADMVDPLAQQRGDLVKNRAALLDVGRAPFRPGAVGGGKRLLKVGLVGVWHLGDAVGGDRVDDRMRLAAFAALPHAVDE